MSNKKNFCINIFNIHFIFLYIILIINSITPVKSIENVKEVIIFPFKIYHPKVNSEKETTETNYLTSLLRQKTFLEISNSSGQKASMILTLEQIFMHTKEDISLISSEEENNLKIYKQNIEDICYFKYKNSPTFKCQTPYNIFMYERSNCCIAEEQFILYQDQKLTKKIISPILFIHTTNEENICFFSSLQKNPGEKDVSKSFINQLKKISGSSTYSWTLKYTSQDEGLFIFGDIIDNENIILEENNKIKNIETNYDLIYSSNVFNTKLFWKIYSDKLFFGNYILGENENSYIDINIPFILLKREYYRHIKESIFKKYLEEKICNMHIPEYKLSAISCDKKLFLEKTNNLKILPSLTFNIKQYNLNLTFNPNDLFMTQGDRIYFMLAHNSYRDRDITIGNILLKKYHIIFDEDSKLMKILKNSNNNVENYKENNNDKSDKTILIVILAIILSGLIFGILGLKYGKKIYQARKRKANELDDDNYDYLQYKLKKDINFDKNIGDNSKNNINNNDVILKGISLEMTNS